MSSSPSASASATKTVLWLPSHPAAGGVSMDRYWRELDHQRGLAPHAGLRVICPVALPAEGPHPSSRLSQAWHKYAAYPAQAAWISRGVDAAHVLDQSYAHLLRFLPRNIRKISTVHDLIPLRDSTGLNSGQLARFRRTAQALTLCDLLVADSEFTARDIVHLLGYSGQRIRVLPLGVASLKFDIPQRLPEPISAQLAGRRTLLHVSATNIRRKNLEVLPAILRLVRDKGHTLTFAKVGPPLEAGLAGEIRRALEPGGALLELGHLSEENLIALYQVSDALVFPSWLEGFGFPLIEAMAAGCPVVSSNASSLSEVGGNAVLYFNPEDPAQAANHLNVLLRDGAFRLGQIQAGHQQAARFTWEQHWRELARIYDQVLN